MTDAATSQKSNFELKDILVIVPLVGSSIAICWEVGTFLPIGGQGWSFLSLTEHINRALQALPFALAFSSGVVAGGLAVVAALSRVTATAGDQGVAKTPRSQLPEALIVAALLIGLGIYFRFITAPLFAVLLVLIVIGQRVPVLTLRIGLALIGMSFLVLSFSAGADFTRLLINNPLSLQSLVNLKSSETVRGIVLATGDRGVLVYRRDDQTFIWVSKEELVRVDWPRKSFWRS